MIDVNKLYAIGISSNPTYRDAVKQDVIKLQNDNAGDYIKEWNHSDAQPTDDAINAFDDTEYKTNEAWRKIREERNQLLKDSDYIMFPDITISAEKKEEWETYRQVLRDIPQDYDSPDEVVYPDKPE